MKTKLILEIVLPIISLIAMIILFTQFYSSSQEKIEGIQKKLDVATSDVIKVCYDFKQRQNQIKNDYGRLSYAYESFINRNRADLDGCENEIPKIIQSCRDKPEYKNFESCRDERLNSYYQNIQLVENNENLPNCGPGTQIGRAHV